MPIRIPNKLPAAKVLEKENIFIMTETRAITQDIRPLRILLLNLMPTKIETETQFSRLLGNTPLQVDLELIHTKSHISKNASTEHMLAFYKTFDEIKDQNFDGFVITGAPVEQMEFVEVEYWEELCKIMEWSKTHVHSTFHVCWGAQAGLYYHYGIKKHQLEKKLFGVFSHKATLKYSTLFRGCDDEFFVPHSRHTESDSEAILSEKNLRVIADSDEAGIFAIESKGGKQIFITGHPEYDRNTLKNEYERDINAGKEIEIPKNYFKENNPKLKPVVRWRSTANLLYSNWLNYYVYQTTPYDITKI